MYVTGRLLADYCAPSQSYSAVYVRKARRQKFMRRSVLPIWRPSANGLLWHIWPPAKRLPGMAGLILFILASTNQSVSAARHEPWRGQGPQGPSTQNVSLGQTAWSDYLATGLQCRSTIDGSNADLVQQVKARIFNPASFAHIVTTLWPQQGEDYELTMMFRVGNMRGNGQVREARASVNPDTCRARLLSIT